MPRDKLIQIRRGTTAQWEAADKASASDPTRLLADGEIGRDTTTGVLKVGDGATKFADLPGYLDEIGLRDSTARIVPTLPVVAPRVPTRVDAPEFVRRATPILTHSVTGFPTIYWPFVVNVEHIPGALGRWYLYWSTDHDAAGTPAPFNGRGGIGMAYADDLLGPWTVHKAGRSPVVYQDTVIGNQTETPTVIHSDDPVYPLYIYYQQQGTGANQSTLLLKSKTGLLNDPENVRAGIVIQGDRDRPGDGQTTYTKIWRSGAAWIAVHLLGGGNYDSGGISRSHDGIHWHTDPRRMFAKDVSDEPGKKIGLSRSSYFTWRGDTWGLTTWSSYTSGFFTGDRPWALYRPTEDFRGVKGAPLPVATTLAAGEKKSVSPSCVIAHEGELYAFYRSDGPYGAIRAAIAEA